jgi:tetratricopeptide (TPR) repeat protein
MADNWMMTGYFPVMLAAIIWVKGFRSFLNPRFLSRMTLWGLAGAGVCLLLPALQGMASGNRLDFWLALKAHLKSQKDSLGTLRGSAFRLLILTGVLPYLILAVRWKSHTVQAADDIGLGVYFTKASGHFVHGLFFLTSIWIALDPVLVAQNLDRGIPLLIHHYSWALVSGYCAGYFLLFGSRGGRRWPARVLVAATWLLLGVLPVALLWENLGGIRITNGRAVRTFARELYEDLPARKSVALSEEAWGLLLLRSELAARSCNKDVILVETPSLVSSRYHEIMRERFAWRWPAVLPADRQEQIRPQHLLSLVSGFAAREPVVYLHPSSGLFLESFMDEPCGTAHRLVPRPAGEKAGITLADRIVTANEQIWQQRWTNALAPLAAQFAADRMAADRWSRKAWKWLRLSSRPNPTATILGAAWSKSLNYWGVQALRSGRGTEAAEWFRRAVALNPDNLAALINMEYAERLRRGDRRWLTVAEARRLFPGPFALYENWWEVHSRNGPVDEPAFLLHTARALLASQNPRQAAIAFARCAELSPDLPAPKLWQAHCRNLTRNHAGALELADEVGPSIQRLNGRGLGQLLQCRATALQGLGRTNDAATFIERFVGEHGKHGEVLDAAAHLHAANGQFQSELALREELCRRAPDNPELLAKEGLAELRLARYDDAIATLTRALVLSPAHDEARLLRAVARLGADQWEAAREDYELLLKKPGHSQTALFGLGDIAWRERDTNAVRLYYERFLSNSAASSPRAAVASERLKHLTDEW